MSLRPGDFEGRRFEGRPILKAAVVLIILTVPLAPAPTAGAPNAKPFPFARAPLSADLPAGSIPGSATETLRHQDTTWFGDYHVIDGEYYARSAVNDKQAVMWTFDRGNGPTNDPNALDNGEGWKARNLHADEDLYFRLIDGSLDLGLGVAAPVIAGTRSLWVGADRTQSDALCWDCGPGYGRMWCQRATSEPLAYDGSGAITLAFKYFNKSERCYDGTQIYLKRADNTELMLNPNPPGTCDIGYPDWTVGFTDSIGHYTAPATYSKLIAQNEIGGAQEIRIIIEFLSDPGLDDEDCGYPTIWGPFGVDDLTITGGGIDRSYDFESGLQGWTAGFCATPGLYVDIADVGCYPILSPCCTLEGNVLEMHADLCESGVHPVRQWIWVESPICDFGNANLKTIFLDVELYAEMPLENGVVIRPGWKYYPWTCETTGTIGWSPRIGMDPAYYFGNGPVCTTWRFGGTTLDEQGTPIPPDAEKVIAIIELLSDCATFAITNCTGVTNFTPLFDNLAVGATLPPVQAPQITYAFNSAFQDGGSYPSSLFDPRAPGPANTALEVTGGEGGPSVAGDSLVVVGPEPGSDPNSRWEARLWWRIAKRAPLQSDRANGANTRYKIWRDRVADGKSIDRPDRPQFTSGWMDSAQGQTGVYRNRFQSTFRENDDDFLGEGNPESEMIWDDALFPGTRVEYFITSNYVGTPGLLFYLPDTAGSHFMEFEVLPGLRTARIPDCGPGGGDFCVYQPATLYIRTSERSFYVENALRTILNGYPPCLEEEGCRLPEDRNWDRFDYWRATSNHLVGFARGAITGSNGGMTLNQVLGYRAILLDLGPHGSIQCRDEDYVLYDRWLSSPLCGSNTNRQVFIANGNKVGEAMEGWPSGETFLNGTLGAILLCDAFNGHSQDPDCAPEEDAPCVRYLPVSGGPFGTEMDVDAFGNFCPELFGFNVYSTAGTGAGNRYYEAEGNGKQMQYAQVVNQNLGPDANWRTVIDGVSWNYLSRRDAGGSGEGYCPRETPSVAAAVIAEIGAALKWGFGVTGYSGIPRLTSVQDLAGCQGTWNLPAEREGTSSLLVDRLYQNAPNPFNPRTTIRFATTKAGAVEILIYDVAGRQVRKLLSGTMPAGLHSIVWDGANDAGARVGSGVYWVQMKAGSFTSNKKLVTIR